MSREELVVRRDGHEVAVRRGSGAMAYVRPWLTTSLMVPAGWAAHLMWGDAGGWTLAAATGVTTAGATVTYFAHRLTSARTWYAHLISTASTGTCTLWLAAATVAGTGRPMLDLLVLAGGTLAAASNVHTWSAGQGNAASEAPSALPSWEDIAARLGIKGVSMRVTKQTEVQTKGRLTMAPGRTVDDLQDRRKELASAYGVAPGAITIAEDPAHAGRGEITIVTKDLLGQLVPWPGLDAATVGVSIADAPLELGVYTDGEPYRDMLPGKHTLTVGMSGAGKSVHGKIKLVQVAARSDTFVCAIDLAKGKQTLGPVQNAIGWPAYDKRASRALLDALKRAVRARADYLGERGQAQWTRGCGLTFLHVLIEEAAEVADFDELVELLRVARSVGMHIEVSLQRATYGNLDTDARANLGDGVCFGVRDDADASYVLPDYVIAAGAEPARWRKAKPGAAFAAIEFADSDRHVVPVKMFGPPSTDPSEENTVLTPAADSLPDQDAKLDPVTRKAFGRAYSDYRAASAGNGEPTAPVAATAPVATRTPEEAPSEPEVEPIVLNTPDDDPDVTGDLEEEIHPVEGEDFPLTPRRRSKESAEEARAALDSMFQTWLDRGLTTFRAPDVGEGLREIGVDRKRAWVYRQLNRLEEEGRIRHEDDGSWRIVSDALVAA
ncbi:hypothetical protein [Nocardiopsis sp. TNDT3]|uniref:hypothetical protein n=1 Tax=Nocardiopsis sp. TNDT3 TaxID=2249354 RepID=UPI000E3E6D75|nr:hypothetical protein [Nocardiopsis sp. TNDT3]